MFTRLFKSGWENADPAVRRKTLESGEVPDEIVAQLVRSDDDLAVRGAAAGVLHDLALLEELASGDTPAALREAAANRLRTLLSAAPEQAPSLARRIEALRVTAVDGLCDYLASEAQSPELRIAALDRVQDTDLLCRRAIDDPVASARRAALDRISDPNGWERVARDARNRDKQISRLARERLDAFHQAHADHEAAERLCAALENLAVAEVTPASRAEYQRLQHAWTTLGQAPDVELTGRFERATRTLVDAIEHLESALAMRQAICEDLRSLLDGLQADQATDAGSVSDAQERLAAIRTRWTALPPAAGGDERLAASYAELSTQIEQSFERIREDAARAERLRSLIETARTQLGGKAELSRRQVKDLKHRWTTLEQPLALALSEELQQAFEQVSAELDQRLTRQAQQREQALVEADRFIDELEAALRSGQVEQAQSLRDRVRHRLQAAKGHDDNRRAALQKRLHQSDPQLDRLRDWRHWGSGQSRQRLCEEMEALQDSPLDAAEMGARVRHAREEWKHIDHAEGPADEALWHRFDQACTRAYAPFQAQRKERMAQLQAHQRQKQALTEELLAIGRDTDWKAVDWPELDRRVRGIAQQWRRIGPVPRKLVKSVESGFRDALAGVEAHLGKERDRELRRRRALITQMEALADAPDPQAAGREAKQAQREWKPSVQADRKTEQALWKQFRAACDAVFQRIDAERDAAAQERRSRQQQKDELCDVLESLLGDTALDIDTLARRAAEIDERWQAVSTAPGKSERGAISRYEALRKRLAERRRQAARAAAASALEQVREQARLCAVLEAEVLDGRRDAGARAGLVDECRRAWQAPPLDDAGADPLRERFERAASALAGDEEANRDLVQGLEPNLQRRRDLCLQMEVEAGIDSPAEYRAARMQLQVARLEDALKHRQATTGSKETRLQAMQRSWYEAGPVPSAERANLDARFERALDAMQRHE